MKFDARDHRAFFNDLAEEGFHFFSRRNAKCADFYPNAFPSYPEFAISDIKDGDIIVIRAFFSTSKAVMPSIESGHIDLEVEYVYRDTEIVLGNILTELPAAFALSRGTSIEVNLDEVLSVRRR